MGARTALAILLFTVAVGAPGATACNTHQCDGQNVCVFPYAGAPGVCPVSGWPIVTLPEPMPVRREGDFLVWDTATLVGPWLDYGPNTTLWISYPPEFGHQLPTSVQSWITTDTTGDGAPIYSRNYINGIGQLAQYTFTDTNMVAVYNGTCADYGLRVEITAPAPPETPTSDGGAGQVDATITDADAGLTATAPADGAIETRADAGALDSIAAPGSGASVDP